MHVQGAFEPTPRKRKVRVYKEHDAAFAAILHEAQERLARMHVALRDRSIRLCGANNSRRLKLLWICRTLSMLLRGTSGHGVPTVCPRGVPTAEAKTRRLLADEVESERVDSENYFYRFLLNVFASREKRLDSLAAGGRP